MAHMAPFCIRFSTRELRKLAEFARRTHRTKTDVMRMILERACLTGLFDIEVPDDEHAECANDVAIGDRHG
jgi:hypothetical protein